MGSILGGIQFDAKSHGNWAARYVMSIPQQWTTIFPTRWRAKGRNKMRIVRTNYLEVQDT